MLIQQLGVVGRALFGAACENFRARAPSSENAMAAVEYRRRLEIHQQKLAFGDELLQIAEESSGLKVARKRLGVGPIFQLIHTHWQYIYRSCRTQVQQLQKWWKRLKKLRQRGKS